MRGCLIAVMIITALIIWPAGMTLANNTAVQVVEIRIEEIAVMNITGVLSRPLTLTAPANPEAAPTSHTSTYIRYTSVVREGKTRVITAAITAGTLPGGCALKLEGIDLSGHGNHGNIVPGGVHLSGIPQAIITGIGSCYTGTGSTAGAQLAYALIVDDTGSLVPGETRTITISFTLTDAS
ncbi:hypothetical protein KAX17_07980 [Candidatus Bipolaricaulota bacterium]|nr:hypothetical protein [Candidatus Bipolaricaulota bacterium]